MKKQGEGARVGKVLIAGYFPPVLQTRMRVLAAEERTTVQALLSEAIDLLFVRRKQKKGETGNEYR